MSDIDVTKIATNLSNGYVNGSTFVVSSGDYRYDVYKILPNVSYTIQLSDNVGGFLACFVSTVNPENADSNFFGKVIKYIKNPESNSKIPIKYIIEEQEDNEYYLVLYKDDSGLNNIDTRVVLTGSDTRQKLLGYRSPKFDVIPASVLYDYLGKKVTNLSAISKIAELGNYALAGAAISEADLALCESIGQNAFSECSSLQVVSFPVCSVIKSGTFTSCSMLREAYFPVCQSIGDYAFYYCSSLSQASFPLGKYVGSYAFEYCTSLKFVYLPEASHVGYHAFYNCYNLESAYLPRMSNALNGQFTNCSKLSILNLPAVSYVSGGGVGYMSKLETLLLASCRFVSYYGISYCSSLRTVYLPRTSFLSRYAFNNCSMLESVYLLSTSMCSLYGESYTFSYTGINTSFYLGYYGSVFVRVSLLDTYKNDSYWSYYSDRLVGLTDAEIQALPWYEPSHFD